MFKSPSGPGSNPGSGSNFSLEILYCKFPRAQIMSLFSINNLIWSAFCTTNSMAYFPHYNCVSRQVKFLLRFNPP
jgi:hypothetical protein